MMDENQFRKEVNWCVEQLRLGMFNKNPSSKQKKECERVIKILTSTKASLVKKRQAMHQMFGDYRKKIEAEEKAWEKETSRQMQNMKITEKCAGPVRGEFFRTASSNRNCFPSQERTSTNANNDDTFQKDKRIKNSLKTDKETKICKTAKLENTVSENDDDKKFKFNFVIEDS